MRFPFYFIITIAFFGKHAPSYQKGNPNTAAELEWSGDLDFLVVTYSTTIHRSHRHSKIFGVTTFWSAELQSPPVDKAQV